MLIINASAAALATVRSIAESTLGASSPPPAYRPAQQVTQLGTTLLTQAIGVAAGLAAGWLLARAAHAYRLHWSWAAVGTVCLAALGGLGGAWVLDWIPVLGYSGCLAGALLSVRLMWRWHAAESDPLACDLMAPVQRVTAIAALRLLGRSFGVRINGSDRWAIVGRLASMLADSASMGANKAADLSIGMAVQSGRKVQLPAGHALVIGATGSGKTVTLRRIMQCACRQMGIVAVDGKGDPALRQDLQRFAAESGRRFMHWSPQGPCSYNPFAHGHETEIVDKALAAESWGDTYYLRIGQRFLGFAVRALRAADVQVTVASLAHYADPVNLEQLARAMEANRPGSWSELAGSLPRISGAERQAIAGTQHRLATIAESDVGHLLLPAPGHICIDLLESVQAGDVVYFDLNADARPELARMLGGALVLDSLTVAATLQRSGDVVPAALLFDEVQAFAAEAAMRGMASLFARARSAGMMVLLGTQSLADLRVGGHERSMAQILDNRSSLIVHRLPGHDSASRASLELGVHRQGRLAEQFSRQGGSWQSSAQATVTAIDVPNVTAMQLMDLPTGTAIFSTLGCRPEAVQVMQPS